MEICAFKGTEVLAPERGEYAGLEDKLTLTFRRVAGRFLRDVCLIIGK